MYKINFFFFFNSFTAASQSPLGLASGSLTPPPTMGSASNLQLGLMNSANNANRGLMNPAPGAEAMSKFRASGTFNFHKIYSPRAFLVERAIYLFIYYLCHGLFRKQITQWEDWPPTGPCSARRRTPTTRVRCSTRWVAYAAARLRWVARPSLWTRNHPAAADFWKTLGRLPS